MLLYLPFTPPILHTESTTHKWNIFASVIALICSQVCANCPLKSPDPLKLSWQAYNYQLATVEFVLSHHIHTYTLDNNCHQCLHVHFLIFLFTIIFLSFKGTNTIRYSNDISIPFSSLRERNNIAEYLLICYCWAFLIRLYMW